MADIEACKTLAASFEPHDIRARVEMTKQGSIVLLYFLAPPPVRLDTLKYIC